MKYNKRYYEFTYDNYIYTVEYSITAEIIIDDSFDHEFGTEHRSHTEYDFHIDSIIEWDDASFEPHSKRFTLKELSREKQDLIITRVSESLNNYMSYNKYK